MTVMKKHRIITHSWVYGKCENCGHNPREVKMVQENMTSGDPEGRHESKEKIWVCPRCGYTRKL